MTKADVVVVGGGVIGMTTALTLQQRGAHVTVLTARPGRHGVDGGRRRLVPEPHRGGSPGAALGPGHPHRTAPPGGDGVPGWSTGPPGCGCATATPGRPGGPTPAAT
ncbi:FAD-dependent oxidoreductase [Micromonospora sp. BRA006-A]|nr:FAD-dependent oxidoreductase [Micromonospora sp. BRA006-A]